jgi:hypothetical protein
MDVYLPIAEMSVNLFLLLGLGGAVGFLSGVFGVGGGFLIRGFVGETGQDHGRVIRHDDPRFGMRSERDYCEA